MHHIQPNNKFSSAIGIQKNIIQITFAITDGIPPPYSTSFPNSANDKAANLKHCFP